MAIPRSAHWSRIGSALLVAAVSAARAQPVPPIPPPALAAAGPTSAGQTRPPIPLHLEAILNRTPHPEPLPFELRGDRLHASAATLRALGFALDGYDDGMHLAPDEIAGVRVRYEPAHQRVHIDAPLETLALGVTTLGGPPAQAPVVADASPGLLLNYDLFASDGGEGWGATAFAELRAFGAGPGVFSTTGVARIGTGASTGGRMGRTTRLDTRWQFSFPDRAIGVTVGDVFTGFLDWSRPVRIGGLQIGRNFALQPYRITAPLPEFLGEAAVPSEVELYVDGIRQYSGRAPTGPFRLTPVPNLTGAGSAQIVVTDAFGRVRTLDFPFYATQRLLARGLSDWSLSLGAVREDYGLRSFAYASQAVGSGTWRYGASDRLTVEALVEAGGDLRTAGLGAAWQIGMAGVVHAAHARSRLDGAAGAQSSLGWTWTGRRYHLSLETRRAGRDYRDIASLYGAPPPTRNERALAGANTRAGSFSLSYVRLDRAADPAREQPADRARYAGLYWNRGFGGRWSANLSLNRNLDDADDFSAYLGVIVPLGRDRATQLAVSWQHDGDRDDAVADLARPVPGDGGFGWRLQARAGDSGGGGLAEAGWLGPRGRIGAGVSRFGDSRLSYAQASGSVVRMGGGWFAARELSDAFAVVSAAGLAGVPVELENRLVGVTDRRGLLLVTPLNAWQLNRLSVDPMDLPPGVRVDRTAHLVAPPDRAGVRVDFAMAPVRAAMAVLHDADGAPLPAGSRARVRGRDATVVVGHDGHVYLEHLDDRHHLHVSTPGGDCVATLELPEDAGHGIHRIGGLPCVPEASP
ncbi:fimbria/pilus outer membrane usher protein [Luteimonas huabeiensis]|uniref:fimbria/pilus outer membrane usher protein n=1 Tax=Luteimonas huabeiensis TaxID=1244513 RepID=UPI0004650CE7|nr:fimbria/pilus outer membrane usher protein [Luteimonas huabeiensis]